MRRGLVTDLFGHTATWDTLTSDQKRLYHRRWKGHGRDSVVILQRALEYLARHRSEAA